MNNLLIYHGLVGGGDGRSGGSSSTRTPKDLAKKLAKMQQIADRTGEEFVGENVYYDRFDGLNKQSLAQIDLTSFEITTNSSNIINTNDIENLAKLKVGQEVTLLKGSNIERVIIDSIENGFFTINKPIQSGMFNGGTVARSMATIYNGKLMLIPQDAPEFDIRYKITPKEKQPNKIYTWVKYDNPSQCDVYDSVVNKAEENLTHYEGVIINGSELNEEEFKLSINYTAPKIARTIKLYIGYGEKPTINKFDQEITIEGRGENSTIEVSIPSLDKSLYYRFICTYEDGTINDSVNQCGVYEINGVYKYIVRIHKNVDDPSLAVEYIGEANEVENWDEVEPFKSIRPVTVNLEGEVTGEIDKNDFSKLISGAPISSYDDTMIEFPRVYWKSINTETYTDIIISNKKIVQGMEAYAHFTGGVDKEFLYVGAYRSYRGYTDNKQVLRSKYNEYYSGSYSIDDFRIYAKNRGSKFGLMTWNTMSLLKVLFILRYKTLHSQGVCGIGCTSNYNNYDSSLLKVGMTTDSKGSSNRKSVKLFGIEDIWGGGYTFIDGLFMKKDNIRIAKDNLACKTEYTNGTDIPITLEGTYTTGRLEEIQGVGSQLFYPKRITNASSDKFYSDRASVYTGTSYYGCMTAYYNSSSHAGLFGMEYASTTSTNSAYYSRIIML